MPIKDVKSPSVSAEPVIFGETFNASLRVCHQKKHVLLVCSLIIQLPVFFFHIILLFKKDVPLILFCL